ncbi:hypothetical protein NARC_30295 [Candidatus Nitrosocosmicus arcticus]|uniref:Uncharacterized protein n=1 Tax=Candidatus Nitrosocosmicus arcticus TaxID=2035267 RepID=A0A557SY96_9ARCH|nr:hypothetical protein NARC_30295 [Candidatus Nitrosocosmicus arcticus]
MTFTKQKNLDSISNRMDSIKDYQVKLTPILSIANTRSNRYNYCSISHVHEK